MNPLLRLMSLLSIAALTACGSSGTQSTADAASTAKPREMPAVIFDADSAYAYVAAQTTFGPRVPNTCAHRQCADWIVGRLQEFGASDINVQEAELEAYDGTKLQVRNISASINPQARKRILLLAHWDSRPWADHDPDTSKRGMPIDGANDGASGVGVILEIVRNLMEVTPKIGVDVLFADAEDYGTRADDKILQDDESSWALGTQYWVENPTLDLDKIRYAVLLDMVGGKDAVFDREYFSQHAAPQVMDKIWKAADKAGYGARFTDQRGMPVVDDHIYLLRAGIPTVDIIEISHPDTSGFNPTWHTHADNIDNIDKNTLGAVGQTLLNVIYSE